jgi:hypothetical protein
MKLKPLSDLEAACGRRDAHYRQSGRACHLDASGGSVFARPSALREWTAQGYCEMLVAFTNISGKGGKSREAKGAWRWTAAGTVPWVGIM